MTSPISWSGRTLERFSHPSSKADDEKLRATV
jgi:hypothetical protein